jgi:hypothetical protein
LRFTRFRQRPVQDPLGAAWVTDEDFDLGAHLVKAHLPEPCGKLQLEEFAADLASARLDPAHPLWQVHFVGRYESGSAWVVRLHHCYADGTAMIRVLLSLTEQDADPAPEAGAHARQRQKTSKERIAPDLLPLIGWVDQLSRPAGDILESALVEGARLVEGGVLRLLHAERSKTLARHAGGMAGSSRACCRYPKTR